MTYADKYALMKAYKIITGDDPDQNKSPDRVLYESKIDKTKIQALQLSIKNAELSDETVSEVLKSYGYKNIEDIEVAKYKDIVDVLKAIKTSRGAK